MLHKNYSHNWIYDVSFSMPVCSHIWLMHFSMTSYCTRTTHTTGSMTFHSVCPFAYCYNRLRSKAARQNPHLKVVIARTNQRIVEELVQIMTLRGDAPRWAFAGEHHETGQKGRSLVGPLANVRKLVALYRQHVIVVFVAQDLFCNRVAYNVTSNYCSKCCTD